jgi:hypothetical protein
MYYSNSIISTINEGKSGITPALQVLAKEVRSQFRYQAQGS